jgi:hypothetical protein
MMEAAKMTNYFADTAMPKGILEIEGSISPLEATAIAERWMHAQENNLPIILGDGVKFAHMGRLERLNVFLEEVDNYSTSTLDLGLEALVGNCLVDLKAMS